MTADGRPAAGGHLTRDTMDPNTTETPKTTPTAAAAATLVRDQYIDKKIIGARKLTADDVELINAIKAKGQELEQLLARVYLNAAMGRKAAYELGHEEELKRIAKAEPERWVELGRVDLQRGLMSVIRAVAQPSGF